MVVGMTSVFVPSDLAFMSTSAPALAAANHDLTSFIAGLPAHLAPGGRAVLTHNGFVGLEASRTIARDHGLSLRILLTVLVYIAEEKLARMTPAVLRAENGRSLHRYGPYAFGEMHIVEVGAA